MPARHRPSQADAGPGAAAPAAHAGDGHADAGARCRATQRRGRDHGRRRRSAPPPRPPASEPQVRLPPTRRRAGRGPAHRDHRDRRQPPRRARRRPLLPAREARATSSRSRTSRATSTPSGTRASSTTSRSTSTTNDRGVVLRFIVRERPNIKEIDVRGQRRDRERQAQRGRRDQAEHDPERAGRAPQRAEDQGRLRREGLLPRRRRRTRSSRSARTRSSSSSRSPSTSRSRCGASPSSATSTSPTPSSATRCRPATAASSSFGSGGPYRQDVFERDVLMLSALYYDKGYLSVQIGTPRVMLTPDREGIDIAIVIHEGPALQDPPAPHLRARQRRQGDRAARRPARAAPDDPRALGRLLQPRASSSRTSRPSARSTATPASRTSRPSPRRSSIRSTSEVDIVVPIRRGPPVHIERIEVKGNTKTRDKVIRREMEIQEGQLFSETGLENSKRRITALGYFERVDVSTEQGSAPDKIIINFEVAEKPDRHVPGRRRLQLDRELHRHRAGPAGEPLRQRAVARLAGAGLGAAAARHACASSSRTSSTRDWNVERRALRHALRLPELRAPVGRRVAHLRLRAHPAVAAPLRSPATAEWDSVDTSRRRHVLRRDARASSASSSSCRSRTSSTPGASSRSARRSRTTRATTASSRRPASSSRRRRSSRRELFGSQFNYLRNRFTGRFYYPLGGGNGHARLGLRPQAEHRGRPHHEPRRRRAFRSSSATSSAASSTSAASTCAASARACRSTSTLDPNAPPIANGANIGGNLEAYENLELEFPIIDKVGIRGVVFFDAGNAWNLESQFCKTTPAPQFDQRRAALLQLPEQPRPTCARRTGFGIRWFSPLGPLRFEWGFPLAPLPYEQPQRLRVHDRQLLLIAARLLRRVDASRA